MREVVFLLAVTTLALAEAPKVPTIDQALSLKLAGGARISPDGAWVAYTVNEADWEDNEFKTQIWLARSDGSARFQLTRGKKSSSSPRWSPDSKTLAFSSGRDGKNQIYLVAPAGGEAWALTADETGVQGFDWAPDGKSIAYTSTGPEAKKLKDRKDKYGEIEVVEGDYENVHLFLAAVPGEPGAKAKSEQLTSGTELSVQGVEWAPDSKRIVFTAGKAPDLSLRWTTDVYVLDVATKSVKKIVDSPGPDFGAMWSPDGSEILYLAGGNAGDDYYRNPKLMVVPAAGGVARPVAAKFDEEMDLIRWAPEGLYFGAMQKTSAALWLMDVKSGSVKRLAGDEKFGVFGVSLSDDRRTAAFTGAEVNGWREVYVASLTGGAPRRLSDNAGELKGFQLASREVVSWKSKDGATIEGVLMKPADFQAGRKYPLLVIIHGGPTGVDSPYRSPDRTYPAEIFAAKGALILRPNYRGSAGYGEAFRSLNVRNLGVGDAWDVLSGVDSLVSQGLVDPAKAGAMGWSQGGYISAFLTTTSDRFKAISVGAGISDWMTYYVNTDIHPFTRQYLKATPWDDGEIYRKTSPISYIKQAKTPTLIQHGGNDRRVPLPNAYELYQGLKDQGVEARLVVYKGFGHGINKPKQARHVMEENLNWFSRYIWGEQPAQ